MTTKLTRQNHPVTFMEVEHKTTIEERRAVILKQFVQLLNLTPKFGMAKVELKKLTGIIVEPGNGETFNAHVITVTLLSQ